MMRDDDLGIVRRRAFGTLRFPHRRPKLFLKEVAGSDQNFRLDEFADTMRSRIVASLPMRGVPRGSRSSTSPPGQRSWRGAAAADRSGRHRQVPPAISSFIVENVSVPPEVEQAIDKRSAWPCGNLNDYVKFQMARGWRKVSASGGIATELAVGPYRLRSRSCSSRRPGGGGGRMRRCGARRGAGWRPARFDVPRPMLRRGARRRRGRRHVDHRVRRARRQRLAAPTASCAPALDAHLAKWFVDIFLCSPLLRNDLRNCRYEIVIRFAEVGK